MGIVSLFIVALMPVLKAVFYVLCPALAGTCLAESITFQAFGWVLIKITKTPKHLKGIVMGCCSAGNLGNLLLILLPAVCEESNSPFGDPSVCSKSAKPYVAISLSFGSIYIWSYTYGIMRLCANKSIEHGSTRNDSETVCIEIALPSTDSQTSQHHPGQVQKPPTSSGSGSDSDRKSTKILILKTIQRVKTSMRKIDLKKLFAPTLIGAIVGFVIGVVSPFRKLLIGNDAPLRVIDSSAYILGEATIPCMTLIMGANLLKGLKGSDVSPIVIIGIIVVRNIFLPLSGIGVVKAAHHLGMVRSDPLYQFVLMLQYSVPPAMAVGTITEFFQLGQGETSVVMLWTYAVAAVTVTLWSTFFMWLLA
ncbi:Auxin efflux carrier [Corchorus olitorius]|uniref:Auxin efflux carrier n=1 Tax=Corchorus olitorius TaxID=93759 RepID=A0A1R3GN85_9ROSI|nr:Auxin efflux carrier [Corchorus olitorius]